jgi:hypothetical protein
VPLRGSRMKPMPQEQPNPPPPPSTGQPGARRGEPDSLHRNAFWAPTTLEQLAAEQAVRLPQDIDALVGQGADLWDSDEDLEHFLASVAEGRGRAATPGS